MYKKTLILQVITMCVTLWFVLQSVQHAHAQIIINEVATTGEVELLNTGESAIDVSGYWLVNFPTYLRLDNASIFCDSLVIAPGELLTLDSVEIDGVDGELALFSAQGFSNPFLLQDYIEWGSSGHFTANLALQAGIWTEGDFIFRFDNDTSLEYLGTGNRSSDWVSDGTASFCEPNDIDPTGCNARASEIFSASNLITCVDGFSDNVTAIGSGGGGDSTLFVITDVNNRVLNADADWPVDFELYPTGAYYIRQLSYSGQLTGLVEGQPLGQIDGCVTSSNLIEVIRQEADGGLVVNASGNQTIQGCAGGIRVEMDRISNATGLPYLYVLVQDSTNRVIFSQNAATDSIIVITDTVPGIYRVFGVSGEITFVPAGADLDLLRNQPCIDVSRNSLRIITLPNGNRAAEVATTDALVYCPDDFRPPVQLSITGTEAGDAQRWILADDAGDIIQVSETSTVNIDTLQPGSYQLLRISYDFGLDGLMDGGNLSGLLGCFDLSSPLPLVIEQPVAGTLTTASGDNRITYCAGSARVAVVAAAQASSVNYYYVVADVSNDSIVAVVPRIDSVQVLDLSFLPEGDSRIYGWSQTGPLMAEPGMFITDLSEDVCADLSDDFILLVKTPNPYEGGRIAVAGPTQFCLDTVADEMDVILTLAVTDSSAYLVTTEMDSIVSIFQSSTVSFDSPEPGLRKVYHLSYGSDVEGLEVGNHLNELQGCVSLSNSIEVRRDIIDGGLLQPLDSIVNISACDGGVFVDIRHATEAALLPYHYLVVELPLTIVAVLDPNEGPSYDLTGLPVDNYAIFGWSHTGNNTVSVGDLISLASDDDCEELSSNSIFVSILPNASTGGTINTDDETVICVDSLPDFVDIDLQGADGIVRINYVITDEQFNIIDVPDDNPPYNVDDGIPGKVLLYNMAHNGAIGGLVAGNNLSQVRGCYSLSNAIEIDKVQPDAGRISTALGEERVEFCAGDINLAMQVTQATQGLGYSYLLTDADGIITSVYDAALSNEVSFMATGPGDCRIYGWTYDTFTPNVEGRPIEELNGLSCSATTANFVSVTKLGSQTNGGVLTASNLDTPCSDGMPDPIEVVLTGSFGANSSWLVVDEDGTILSLPFAPPFNLDPAGPGDYQIYNVSYEDGLEGLQIFGNINELRGCFDLSNPLLVTNVSAEASVITTDDPTEICLGAGQEFITFAQTAMGNGQGVWVVTDANGVIETFSNTGMLDFSALGAGVSLVSRINYVGTLDGLEVGNFFADLQGCWTESNRIMITRTLAQAGMIRLSAGNTEVARCVGDALLGLTHSTANPGQQYSFVLTDAANDILEVFAASPTIDLSNRQAGAYRIYGWSSDGNTMANVGQNVFTLETGCSDVTNAFVSVQLVNVDGSTVVSTSGPVVVACIDGVPDPLQLFTTSTATALPYSYLIVNLNGAVLSVTTADLIDLETGPATVYRVYGYSHSVTDAPLVGDNIAVLDNNSCGDLSENFVTVTRQEADGGTILSEFGDQFTICVDAESDPVLFTPNTASTSLDYSFVITDANNVITHVFGTPLIDFNALGVGESRVFGWSHDEATMAQVGQDIGALEQGCGDLSANFIIVSRVSAGPACSVATSDEQWSHVYLYPNPAVDRLQVAGIFTKLLRVTAVNALGVQISVPHQDLSIDVSSLPSGVYTMLIELDKDMIRKSVLITR